MNDKIEGIKKYTLEKVQLGLSKAFIYPSELDLDIFQNQISGEFVAKFRAYFWGRAIQREVQQSHRPKTWWDAFKKAYFPVWLLNRFPISREIIYTDIKTFHIYPQMDIETPYMKNYIEMLTWEGHKNTLNLKLNYEEEYKKTKLELDDWRRNAQSNVQKITDQFREILDLRNKLHDYEEKEKSS